MHESNSGANQKEAQVHSERAPPADQHEDTHTLTVWQDRPQSTQFILSVCFIVGILQYSTTTTLNTVTLSILIICKYIN